MALVLNDVYIARHYWGFGIYGIFFDPPIYGGIYMGRYGGGRGKNDIYIYNNNNNIIIYNIYSILARS